VFVNAVNGVNRAPLCNAHQQTEHPSINYQMHAGSLLTSTIWQIYSFRFPL